MTDTDNDRPRFDTCDDVVGQGLHYLDSAWGHEWCECNHTCIVHQHTPHDIDPDSLPMWWNRALREAIDATKDPGFDLDIAWVHLRELARDLGADGSWERWDEFGPHVMSLEPAPAEQFLRLLDAAGIATVTVGAWEYQGAKDVWHRGGCCIEVDVRLNAEQAPEPKHRFSVEHVLEFLSAPDGDWDNELNAWVNVKVDGSTAVMTFNPTLGEDEDPDPEADRRERFRVTVERIEES
jgi:hypothetical protein